MAYLVPNDEEDSLPPPELTIKLMEICQEKEMYFNSANYITLNMHIAQIIPRRLLLSTLLFIKEQLEQKNYVR